MAAHPQRPDPMAQHFLSWVHTQQAHVHTSTRTHAYGCAQQRRKEQLRPGTYPNAYQRVMKWMRQFYIRALLKPIQKRDGMTYNHTQQGGGNSQVQNNGE